MALDVESSGARSPAVPALDRESAPRWRRVRVVAPRTVATFLALIVAVAVTLVTIAGIWPHAPGVTGDPVTWWTVLGVGVLVYAFGRVAWLLWHRQRIGAMLAASLFGTSVLGNYYGPTKGKELIALPIAMLALLAFGWRELE